MTTQAISEWIYINDIIHPPYKEDVILLTDKGIISGYLISTDESGHHYTFYTKNITYYSNAKVLAYQPYPVAPKKEKQ